MAQPFLGGFDVPRPQLVDIDGDGDLDLFVQERSNAVMYLRERERHASPGAPTAFSTCRSASGIASWTSTATA